MPDARWSMHIRSKNDRRCPMHGKLRMPNGRCTMHAGVPIPVRTSGPLVKHHVRTLPELKSTWFYIEENFFEFDEKKLETR